MPEYFRPVTVEEHQARNLILNLANYRVTLGEYTETLTEQNNGCAICGRVDPGKRLSIDHDHSCCATPWKACGKCVRGLLCQNCNVALGKFQDNIELLLKAVEYLRFWKANPRPARNPLIIPHGNIGRKHRPSSCQSMSITRTGRTVSEETKSLMSKSQHSAKTLKNNRSRRLGTHLETDKITGRRKWVRAENSVVSLLPNS
jgi:hypothetical protein